MSDKYEDRQARRYLQQVRKQTTFPERSQTLTPTLRRAVTLPNMNTRRPALDRPAIGISPLAVTRRGCLKRQHMAARPVSNVSESDRSSLAYYESDCETDAGNASGLEQDFADFRPHQEGGDAATPPTPQTVDMPSDDKVVRYTFRVDDLKPPEKEWFEKIKMFGDRDEPDDPGPEQFHSVAPLQYGQQPSTNAFGKLDFEGESRQRGLPSWFVRIASNTPKNLIQELLDSRLEVLSRDSYPIRIHCIDYSQWPDSEKLPQYSDSLKGSSVTSCVTPGLTEDLNAVVTKLKKDLWSMCKKTAGIVLTWSGRGQGSIMDEVLGGIMEIARHRGTDISNMACIATPAWKDVDDSVRATMQVKGDQISLNKADRYSPDISPAHQKEKTSERATLGPEISQYATHFFLLEDDSKAKASSNFRHFHYKMMEVMEEFEKQKSVQMPVICVLLNGHHDALKMVVYALEKGIPVVVVKGSGGYADIIADVYLNAVLETTKDWDESGQVRTRVTKRAESRGKWYLEHCKASVGLLQKIFDKLDLLTVYVPSLSVQTLDSVVFETLLKHKQQAKFKGLVEVMQKNKKMQQDSTSQSSFIDSDEVQMNFFIEALKQNSVEVVKIFMNQLQITDKLMHHFHMGRVLRLYSQNAGQREWLITFRKTFVDLLKSLTVLPLQCVCEGCPNCNVSTNTQSKESELEVQRTCLHPIQELFLWALHDCSVDLAVIFWQACDDKIAAALVAWKMFKSKAKEISDPGIQWQMKENVRQFQDLAISTLRSCHNMDETKTELLLTKQCPWWGNWSVLQLAIITENREFMTHTACTNIMTLIWRGSRPNNPHLPRRPCQLVDNSSDTDSSGRCCRLSPFVHYVISFLMQVAFLILFSYGLLFDLGHGLTVTFIVLIIFVASFTLEELRQLVSKHPVLRDSTLETSVIKTRLQTYLRQRWNQLDVVTLLLFWLGMVVFAPVPVLQTIGRCLLSFDIFFFFMRTFQMLMVFEELGLMLVMVFKMVKDTINFMVILLVFVLAYAITSESLLYPESTFTGDRLFNLPRKAYWQVFGELSLEEIEIRESDSCSVNRSKHFGYDEPHCPTTFGSYMVPFLLGVHVMITNVLLLNLLIARFGVTFNKVHDEACEYQSWHRCQIISEYYNRTLLPPPFNILSFVGYMVRKVCLKAGGCLRRLGCHCCRRRTKRPSEAGNAVEMRRRGQGVQQDKDSRQGSVTGEENPLMTGNLKARRSADKRSIYITWTNDLPTSPQQGSSQQGADQLEQEVYDVVVVLSTRQDTVLTTKKFQVARKPTEGEKKKQAFRVWDLDPSAVCTVSVSGRSVSVESSGSEGVPKVLLEAREFENKQAEWVCRQKESDMSWLNDLQEQTDMLVEEIRKMADEHKDNHVALKEDVGKTDKKVSSTAESLEKVAKNSRVSQSTLKKIDSNFKNLQQYFTEATEAAKQKKEEPKSRKKKAKEMTEKRREVEEAQAPKGEELQKAGQELGRLQAEKQAVTSSIQALTQALQDQRQELQALQQEQQAMVDSMAQWHRTLQQEQQALVDSMAQWYRTLQQERRQAMQEVEEQQQATQEAEEQRQATQEQRQATQEQQQATQEVEEQQQATQEVEEQQQATQEQQQATQEQRRAMQEQRQATQEVEEQRQATQEQRQATQQETVD